MRMRFFLALTTAITVAALPSHAVDVFHFEGRNAKSQGMGGLATATDIGVGGLINNPATLSLGAGRQVEGGLMTIGPTPLEVTNRRTGETVEGDRSFFNGYYIPYLGASWRFGDVTVGAGLMSQGGLGTEWGQDSFLSRLPSGVDSGLEVSSKALFARAPVALSWKASEQLTLGAGVDLVYTGLSLGSLAGVDQVGAYLAQGRLSGSLLPVLGPVLGMGGGVYLSANHGPEAKAGVDSFGVSGRVGATFTPVEGTRLGFSYQLPTYGPDLEGRGKAIALTPQGVQVPLNGTYKISGFNPPAELSLGISQKIGDKIELGFDYRRVLWSDQMKDIEVRFQADGGGDIALRIPQSYNDINIFAVGGQYQATDSLTLRAGYRYSDKVYEDNQLLPILPVLTQHHLSLGASWSFTPSARLDVAYSYGWHSDTSVTGLPNASALAPTEFSVTIQALMIGFNWSF